MLTVKGKSITTKAMIDSGVAANLIDSDFARSHISFNVILCWQWPLGTGHIHHITGDISLQVGTLHKETIRLFLIKSLQNPIILGFPWLQLHDPQISWSERQITHWSEYCHQNCMLPHNRNPIPVKELPAVISDLPSEYQDLIETFSKTKASQLPLHRPSDCAIELLQETTLPKGQIFPLSQPESDAMQACIDEELAKGFIRPSTSPASAGFFFVKKDGSLRPCIDYRGLNEVTIKFCYPLVPAALEQLRTAKYFTKLDLRSAYNLIRICEGDEWETAFSTTTGHYEYLVMLVNSLSVFQAFINKVF